MNEHTATKENTSFGDWLIMVGNLMNMILLPVRTFGNPFYNDFVEGCTPMESYQRDCKAGA